MRKIMSRVVFVCVLTTVAVCTGCNKEEPAPLYPEGVNTAVSVAPYTSKRVRVNNPTDKTVVARVHTEVAPSK